MRGVYIYLRIYIFVFVFPPPSPFFVVGLPPALGPFLPLVDEIHCAKYSPPPYFGTDHPLPLPHIRIKTGGYRLQGTCTVQAPGTVNFTEIYTEFHSQLTSPIGYDLILIFFSHPQIGCPSPFKFFVIRVVGFMSYYK